MHSVAEFTHEAIEGVTHADSRLWKTLWLLIAKPGVLTLEFVEGRRARYLPPFRLYLVLSVLMFLIIALVRLMAPRSSPKAARRQAKGERELVPTNETPEQRAQRICDGGHIGVVSDEWEKRLLLSCRKVVVDNGHAFAQALLHNIPRALFVLIPLIALIMSAMYWRRYYVEHLLFLIHNHAFTFVLYAVLILATRDHAVGLGEGILRHGDGDLSRHLFVQGDAPRLWATALDAPTEVCDAGIRVRAAVPHDRLVHRLLQHGHAVSAAVPSFAGPGGGG